MERRKLSKEQWEMYKKNMDMIYGSDHNRPTRTELLLYTGYLTSMLSEFYIFEPEEENG